MILGVRPMLVVLVVACGSHVVSDKGGACCCLGLGGAKTGGQEVIRDEGMKGLSRCLDVWISSSLDIWVSGGMDEWIPGGLEYCEY